jgi:hypothetical protein
LTEREASKRYRRTIGYRGSLHMLKLTEIDVFLQSHRRNLHHLQIEGYRNLLNGLDEFFEEESNLSNISIHDDSRIETFTSVALESTDIVHATSSFHGKEMFSDVIVSAKNEEGNEVNWYSRVRMFRISNVLANAYILTNILSTLGIAITQVLQSYWT